MSKKYILYCPKCRSTHDVSSQLNVWKEEFFGEIEDLVKKLKRQRGKNEK